MAGSKLPREARNELGEAGPVLQSKPEVLAPAGGWSQMKAAAENGADCVYFGLDSGFNARARAANFDADELPEVMRYLHDRGVKGYVTLNILIFDEELESFQDQVRQVAAAGVDAVIVQDLGAVDIIRGVAPGLTIHGSTQMSITSGEGAEFVHARGVKRVVVGRELSLKEIAQTHAHTGAEVEAFVHGALCVSYSGQCFSSEAWGGRSANRGQCAQACRLPYGLIVNGELRELGDTQYLLSPQDLAAVGHVPQLIQAGVTCFKIEGRLKGPEYVALVTRTYRDAVDAAWDARAETPPPGDLNSTPQELLADLAQVFARGQDEAHRGLTPGFLEGVRHQRLVRGLSPRHRGVYAGVVSRVKGDAVWVSVAAPLKRGDGVVFDAGDPQAPEEGGVIYELLDPEGRSVGRAADCPVEGGEVRLVFGEYRVEASRLRAGDRVWKNKDVALEARIQSSFTGLAEADLRRDTVTATVTAAAGAPVALTLTDGRGRTASACTASPCGAARSRDLGEASLQKALGPTLGGSTLRLGELDVGGVEPGLFAPGSELKAMRREAVAALVALRRETPGQEGLMGGGVVEGFMEGIRAAGGAGAGPGPGSAAATEETQIRVLCRSAAQAKAVCTCDWLEEVCLDFLEVHGLKSAVEAVRAAGKRVVVATPRVLKPGEERISEFYLSLAPDALLVRSLGMLHQLLQARADPTPGPAIPELQGDFSVNAANSVSADLLLEAGLERLTPTHDMNADQICGMARALGSRAAQLEVVVHQHLPIFHTEHCVFCRFLSDGNSYLDCGHPCETEQLHLRDDSGKDHLVLADMGCRNTVFNAEAQTGLDYIDDFRAAGIRSLRVELCDEAAADVPRLLECYKDAAEGTERAGAVKADLMQLRDANGNAQGVTAGSLKPHSERAWSSLKPSARR